MKNNRGFAISTMMYMILILGITIVAIVLSMFNIRGNILSKLRSNVQEEINDTIEIDYVCVGIDTNGEYNIGDKYSCNVSNTEEYDFYVISSDNDSVNLIMSDILVFENDKIINKVAYITDSDYEDSGEYKPVSALRVLKNNTDNWFYIDTRTDTVDGVSYNNYKARLLSKSDITNNNIEYISDTLTSTMFEDNKIYSVASNEINNEKLVTDLFNIVPVITVNKNKLKN